MEALNPFSDCKSALGESIGRNSPWQLSTEKKEICSGWIPCRASPPHTSLDFFFFLNGKKHKRCALGSTVQRNLSQRTDQVLCRRRKSCWRGRKTETIWTEEIIVMIMINPKRKKKNNTRHTHKCTTHTKDQTKPLKTHWYFWKLEMNKIKNRKIRLWRVNEIKTTKQKTQYKRQ